MLLYSIECHNLIERDQTVLLFVPQGEAHTTKAFA